MSNVFHIFAEKSGREYYSLRQGQAIACVYMRDGLLSHVVVTNEDAEQIDNRAYLSILKGCASELTEAQYEARRNIMLHRAAPVPAAV